MKSSRIKRSAADRARAGFTLVEVLAALLFMAIVIPVAVQGLRLANLAGQVSLRKTQAARLAENILNERVVTRTWQTGSPSGVFRQDNQDYHWQLQLEPWNQGALSLVTVRVTFPVQGRDYDVQLSTVVDTSLR